jgi:hypothetical protein
MLDTYSAVDIHELSPSDDDVAATVATVRGTFVMFCFLTRQQGCRAVPHA